MIKWFKRSQETASVTEPLASSNQTNRQLSSVDHPPKRSTSPSLFSRMKHGLMKTRRQLGDGVSRLLLGKIDSDCLDELETLLIRADVGIETSTRILKQLTEGLARAELTSGSALLAALTRHLQAVLRPVEQPLILTTQQHKPFVILMVGVNGAGKTTTIGKLAQQYQQAGKKVMLAAGDTFRAAAVEQLQAWGLRNEVPVIAQHTGADSASVIFDALQAASARGMDVLIADTAGRLHTQHNLMDELKKIKRVLHKLDSTAPHEIMLVLDASMGQNALNQAQAFHSALGLTGITMTKLDGTAKGGIVFAIANALNIPIRYLGVGEGLDDLQPFDALQFVNALLNVNDEAV